MPTCLFRGAHTISCEPKRNFNDVLTFAFMRDGPQAFWGKDSSQLAQWRLGCSMGRASRRVLLHLALLSAPTLAVEQQLDCEQEVTPVDIVPIRSPQSVHTALARRFAGQSIIEIGTRNGDGMECYARVARHAVAIEIDRSYCRMLMTRSAQMQRLKTGHGHGHRNFTVRCESYEATPMAVFEHADYVEGWMGLTEVNVQILRFLSSHSDRLRPHFEALILHDHDEGNDQISLALLKPFATWHEVVAATPLECARCHHAMKSGILRPSEWVNCGRATMKVHILGFRIRSEQVKAGLAALGSAGDPTSKLSKAVEESRAATRQIKHSWPNDCNES